MKRRQFLQRAAACTIALSLLDVHSLFWPLDAYHLAQPDLLHLLDDQCVHDIGMQYRRLFPQENDPDMLISAILSRSKVRNMSLPSTRQIHLHRQIKYDFTHGQTAHINGWVLSVTEARQCALFSMLS